MILSNTVNSFLATTSRKLPPPVGDHFFGQSIALRGNWLWSPANILGANKDGKVYVGRSTTVHNLLFWAHTLCMNYVTKTFLLVSSSVRSKQLLCFVLGQGKKKREQKHATEKFVGVHNHSSLLTMRKGSGQAIFVGHVTSNVFSCDWQVLFVTSNMLCILLLFV